MDAQRLGVLSAALPTTLLCACLLAAAGCNSQETDRPAVTASIGDGPNQPARQDAGNIKSPAKPFPRDAKHPAVKMVTSLGIILVELDAEKAPITVENFLSYVSSGHYEGTIFHQVVPNYIILGGGFSAGLEEKPVYFSIRNEAQNGLKNLRGTIAMARQPDRIDSSTCQFFFNLGDNPKLDHRGPADADKFGYCVFGKVTEGLDVLDRIAEVPVGNRGSFQSVPVEPVVIQSAVRVR